MADFDAIRASLGAPQPEANDSAGMFKRSEAGSVGEPVPMQNVAEEVAQTGVSVTQEEADEIETAETTEIADIVAKVVKEGSPIGKRLINMDAVRKAMAIGVVAQKNIIYHGVGGHAKSEFLVDVQREWNGDGSVWIQSLNANSNVPDLLGGFSPEAIKNFRFDRPRVEESAFAKANVIVFEEAFDAAPRVITAMKDILTARGWRHGEEFVPMRARSVILVSNHDPEDVRKINPSVDALIQRFPLVVNVMWDTYTEADFRTMLEVLEGREPNPDQFTLPGYAELVKLEPVPFSEEDSELLSYLLAAAVEERAKISPRTAVYCRDVLTAWAAIQGHGKIETDDWEILRLVGDVAGFYDKAWERAKYYMKTADDRNFMRNAKGRFTRAKSSAEEVIKSFEAGRITEDERGKALELARRIAQIKGDINTREWQDETYDGYEDLDGELDDLGSKLLQAAGIKA